MAENSKIEWCDHTQNFWIGCNKVSPGCANCYAAVSTRARVLRAAGHETWGKGNPRSRTKTWGQPAKWNKAAGLAQRGWEIGLADFGDEEALLAAGFTKPARPRVFCSSLSDWLDDEVPVEWLAGMLKVIHDTPNLDWLLLTKRPENWRSRMGDDDSGVFGYARNLPNSSMPDSDGWEMMDFVGGWLNGTPPANVWIGTTVENQEYADRRIPELLKIPAAVRFLSCEPLLGLVKLDAIARESNGNVYFDDALTGFRAHGQGGWTVPERIHWIITGGESGPKARPADQEWFRSLRNQCKASNVAFFMKQLGGVRDARGDIEQFPEDLRVREFPTSHARPATTP